MSFVPSVLQYQALAEPIVTQAPAAVTDMKWQRQQPDPVRPLHQTLAGGEMTMPVMVPEPAVVIGWGATPAHGVSQEILFQYQALARPLGTPAPAVTVDSWFRVQPEPVRRPPELVPENTASGTPIHPTVPPINLAFMRQQPGPIFPVQHAIQQNLSCGLLAAAQQPDATISWYVQQPGPQEPPRLPPTLFTGKVDPPAAATPAAALEWFRQVVGPIFPVPPRPEQRHVGPLLQPPQEGVCNWYAVCPDGVSDVVLFQYQQQAAPIMAATAAAPPIELCCTEFEVSQRTTQFTAGERKATFEISWRTAAFDLECNC